MSTAKARMTVSSPRLVALQRRHAITFNLVPFAATVGAIVLAVTHGVSGLDMALLVGMYLVNFIGIELGFHRHFAHGAFRARPAVRVALAAFGSMAAQGPLLYWVSNHRRHHKYVDEAGDPHSPHVSSSGPSTFLRGLWHAHMGWLFDREVTNPTVFAKDCLRDRLVVRANALYFWWIWLGLAFPSLVGGLVTWSWTGALTGLLWGGLVRTFLVQQVTFSVNSLCHRFGSRTYAVPGQSTNNAWLALPTLGGAWHHNHHAFPFSAVTGFEWWQVDVGRWIIRAAEWMGLVSDVKIPGASTREKKKSRFDHGSDHPKRETEQQRAA